MASRFILPVADVGDGIAPSDGAQLFFFETGTSTPKDTYSDSAGTIPNSNPVIADSDGVFPDIFISGTYKVQLKDKNGVQTGFGEADPVDEVSLVSSTSTIPLNDLRYGPVFSTVAALKSATPVSVDGISVNLVSGLIAETEGYTTSGDGGGARYLIQTAAEFGGTPDGYGDHTLANGNIAVLQSKDTSVAKQFGAAGDGVTNDTAAISAMLTSTGFTKLTAGTYLLGNLTVAKTQSMTLATGASVSVIASNTVDIRGYFSAPHEDTVFTGLGTVIGLSTVRPEWFGAAGDGSTDDLAAFQAMTGCVENSSDSVGDRPTVLLSGKNYGLSASWVVNVSATQSLSIKGAGPMLDGTRLLALTGFSSANGGVLAVEGSADSVQRIVNFEIKDFAIIAQTAGEPDYGVTLNFVQTNFIIGLHESKFENVHVENCDYGFLLCRTRLVNFFRCSVWNNGISAGFTTGVQVRDALTGGDFSGDLTFTTCQFVNDSANTSAYGVYLETNSGTSSLAGIRFNECIIYNSQTNANVNAVDNASIADVWFTDCQFDNIGSIGVRLKQNGATSTGYIADVHVEDCYFTAASANCVRAEADKQGAINSVIVVDNYCAGTSNAAVDFNKVDGAVIDGNMWTGVTWAPGQAIGITDCNQINITDNNFGQGGASLSGGFTYMVSLTGTGDYYVVTGNNSAGLATGALVNNTTAAANTAIANNI